MKKAIPITIAAALAAVLLAASAAQDTAIRATLSPGVTIRYNGEVQAFRDANGGTVHPIMYNGTTYLPIRAIANMLDIPVEWSSGTRTVDLGTAAMQGKSLLSVTDAGTRTTSGNTSRWVKVLDRGELRFNGTAHAEALKTGSVYMMQQTRTAFKLDGPYSTLGFTAYNCSGYAANVQILDGATKAVLWSKTMEIGESAAVAAVNIQRVRELEFVANLIGVPVSARHNYDAVYICDPVVS
jgi:hypothetical protein